MNCIMSATSNTIANKQRSCSLASLLALSLSVLSNLTPASADVVTTRQVETSADGTKTTVTTTRSADLSPSLILSLIDSRRFEVDRLIASYLVNGQMTPGEALNLKTKLADIAAQISAAKIAGYSANDPHIISLGRQLDIVAAETTGKLSISPLTPITILDTTSGVTRIALDAFGNIVAISTVQPNLYQATLDARHNELQRLIAEGIAAQTLSYSQAQAFKQELDRLTVLENRAAANGLTITNVLPIAWQLDFLKDKIIAVAPNSQLTPLLIGTRFVLSNNQVAILDDIAVRRAELEGRIASQLAAGKITSNQAASLNAQMDQTRLQEAAMRADGNLDFKESRQLYTAFDRVATRLDGFVVHR